MTLKLKTDLPKARLLHLQAQSLLRPRGLIGRVRMEATPDEILKSVKTTIDSLVSDVRHIAEDALKQAKESGSLSTDTKKAADENLKALNTLRETYEKLDKRLNGFDASLLELAQKMNAGVGNLKPAPQSVGQQVIENTEFKNWLAKTNANGTCRIPVRMDITSAALSAGELIVEDRRAAIIELPRRDVLVRDLFTQGRTVSNMIEFVRETGFTNAAAVVSEGQQKPESEITFETDTAPIRLYAHWIHVSRQAMDDAPQLQSLIDTRLRYGLDLAEENEILSGDGTGQHMLGVLPQATAFSAAFPVTNRQAIDILRLAILQVELSEFSPDGIVLHPTDWAHIELLKDGQDLYIISNPRARTVPTLWALPVVSTTAMDVDTFLVGAFKFGGTFWTRMDAEVLISSEDRDNFIKNMLTVRAEKRGTITIYRPEAFVTGEFDQNT